MIPLWNPLWEALTCWSILLEILIPTYHPSFTKPPGPLSCSRRASRPLKLLHNTHRKPESCWRANTKYQKLIMSYKMRYFVWLEFTFNSRLWISYKSVICLKFQVLSALPPHLDLHRSSRQPHPRSFWDPGWEIGKNWDRKITNSSPKW